MPPTALGVDAHLELQLAADALALMEGLVSAAQVSGAAIISAGTDAGIAQLLGQALAETQHVDVPLIGIAPFGAVIGHDDVRRGLRASARLDRREGAVEVDAAARVLQPVFEGLTTGRPAYGVFLKDYVETESAATSVPEVDNLQNKCLFCADEILEPLKHHNSAEAVAENIQNVYRYETMKF